MNWKRSTALFALSVLLFTGCSSRALQTQPAPASSVVPAVSSTSVEETGPSAPSTGGKTIVPFTVHGGSGFAGTRQTIAELEPGAAIVNDGLSISRNSVADAEASVVDWVRGLGLNR